MKCDCFGCEAEQTYRIELMVWARDCPKLDGNSFNVELAVWMCAQHALLTRADDVVSDQMWSAIRGSIVKKGLPEPDRSTIDVIAIPCRLN